MTQMLCYRSADAVRGHIFKRNMKAKDEVQKEFNALKDVKVIYSDLWQLKYVEKLFA